MMKGAWISVLGLVAGLAACDDVSAQKDRPQAKPAHLSVKLAAATAGQKKAILAPARVSTKSGDIMILEPDGSVTTMPLGSDRGRAALMATESMMLDPALLDRIALAALPVVNAPKKTSAQEKALAEFAARTGPALPSFAAGFRAEKADFLAVRVDPVKRDGKTSDLIEITANLRAGVDDQVAFAYATCALAGWAKANGSPYARHIRTLSDKRNGKLLVDAAFVLSRTKPLGLKVMETEQTLRECKSRGIPAA